MTEISVETFTSIGAVAIATIPEMVYREDNEVVPKPIPGTTHSYIPWGGDDRMPYRTIARFEEDETLSACHDFLSEALYAGGLRFVRRADGGTLPPYPHPDRENKEADNFCQDNDIPTYWLGVCHDLRLFEFAVSVLILSEDGNRVTDIIRKPAAYCRFSPADENGKIPFVHVYDWRYPVTPDKKPESIPVLDNVRTAQHLRQLADSGVMKAAFVTRLPGKDSLYYPIPSYASIFKGRWYHIKRAIAIAKEAAIKNSTRIKYLIEIAQGYWDRYYREFNLVEPAQKKEAKNRKKQELIDFITGAENSGKALFGSYLMTPDGKEIHDIKITKIESDKEGGDWSADFAEAVNMLCFAMRVHSNLVGSVPGKAQTNNSGSDKRELYMIAQALQKAYRDIAKRPINLLVRYNQWDSLEVETPLLQLTTLDEHKDIKETTA